MAGAEDTVMAIIGTEGGVGDMVAALLFRLHGVGLAVPQHGGALVMDGPPFVRVPFAPL